MKNHQPPPDGAPTAKTQRSSRDDDRETARSLIQVAPNFRQRAPAISV